MGYGPTNRRRNLIRLRCVELVRELMPNTYAKIVAGAEQEFPKQPRGRPRGVKESGPRMTRGRQSDVLHR